MVTIGKIFEELYKRILRIAPKLTGAYWAEYSPEGFLIDQQKKPVRSFLFDEIRKTHSHKPIKNILEVAFGAGYDYLRMKDFFVENKIAYTGLDFSKKAVKYVTKKYGTAHARWMQGDMRNMTMFRDGEFDIVYLYHVIEHTNGLEEARKAMMELCRVTKGKLFIVWFKNPAFLHESAYGGWQKKDRFYLFKHEFADIYNTFNGTGYKVAKVTYIQNCVWEIHNEAQKQEQSINSLELIFEKLNTISANENNKNMFYLYGYDNSNFKAIDEYCKNNGFNLETLNASENYISEILSSNHRFSNIILDCVLSNLSAQSDVITLIKDVSKLATENIFILENQDENLFFKELEVDTNNYKLCATDIWKAFLETDYEIRSIHFADKVLWTADKLITLR